MTSLPLSDALFDKVDFKKIQTRGIYEKDGVLHIPPEAFETLAFEAFGDVSFLLRSTQLEALRRIIDDEKASLNDKFAAWSFLKNACIARERVLPLCQDTGTAVVFGEKGHRVLTDGTENEALCRGIEKAYGQNNLRYSQNVASSFFQEKNSRTNLPAAVELNVSKGDEYRFLFIAKGGGCANKTFLFQETRALLEKTALTAFLKEKIEQIGTSACPPYRLSVVVGGLTAEDCLKTVKLACAGAADCLPFEGDETGRAFRDPDMEECLNEIAQATGYGAQMGGRHFCLSVRCIRLPRHGASLPVGIGVSCVADRNILARISKDGVFLERLEENPQRFLPDVKNANVFANAKQIDLDVSPEHTLEMLKSCKIGEKAVLSGTIIVARDQAHARFARMLREKGVLPEYLKKYPVYYAGPAKTPEGKPCGSMGPTTSGRMDSYAESFLSHQASMVMIGKGLRSQNVLEACRKYGGFYLGTLGGAAALTSAEYIKSCDCIDFEDLGMEAVYRLRVENFPVVVLIDDKGNDFYRALLDKRID